jgi:putative transposase
VERYFRTVKTRFYALLKERPASSLEELNERYWLWLEEDYHRKVHASLDGKMPLEVFLEQAERVRTVDDPSKLDAVFLKRVSRKVKHDGTFSLNNRLYEVPEIFINQRVEIRYDEREIHIYREGKAVVQAAQVKMHDNAHVKRNRSSLSFKSLQEGDGEDV